MAEMSKLGQMYVGLVTDASKPVREASTEYSPKNDLSWTELLRQLGSIRGASAWAGALFHGP